MLLSNKVMFYKVEKWTGPFLRGIFANRATSNSQFYSFNSPQKIAIFLPDIFSGLNISLQF